MKILHVLETSQPNLIGYSIRSKYIVENQKKHGMSPVVVTSPFFKTNDFKTNYEDINGIRYYRTNDIRKPQPGQNKLLSYFTRFRMIQKYKNAVLEITKKEKPDIIHAHSSYTNGHAANYVSKITGIPSIYELRSLWGESAVVEDGLSPNSLKYKMVWNLELKAMKQANRVVPISQGIKDAIIKKGIDPDKIDILPNGVDSKIFVPMEKDCNVLREYGLNDSFVIGYIGSVRKLEGLSCLIDAFQMIKAKVDNVKLIIVGDGPERENLERQAKHLNHSDIIFTGNVPHDKILEYYSVIDLFVFPRINATINHAVTPLKPLEAMACGKVCLCSNVGGLTELIRDDYNGLVFESENVKDLAEKVLMLAVNTKEYNRLSVCGINWVKKERDWSVLIPRYKEIYERVLSSQK